MGQPQHSQIQGLECLNVQNGSRGAICLFHGYGASQEDLFPLWEMLAPTHNWYFPNGPVRVPFGQYWEGRAWFAIDAKALDDAIRAGRHREFANQRPADFSAVLDVQEKFLLELYQQHGPLIIGGFSQGAMCAAHLATRLGDKVKALVLLSSTLVDELGLKEGKLSAQLPVFQSHGQGDLLLSPTEARRLGEVLTTMGGKLEWHPFVGGHEIPMTVVEALKAFLARQ